MAQKANAQARPFGPADRLGYLFGDLGNDFTFIFAGTYLTVYYTDVLGISPGLVGALYIVARCVDAFTDVGMGRLCDTLPPARDGRFRPWLRRMCVPVAAAGTLMYLYTVRGWPLAARVAYMFVTYILWGSVFYTAINIPYGSMASVISPQGAHRASLSTFRSMGAMAAGLVVSTVTPLAVYRTAPDGTQTVVPEGFLAIAAVYGVCAVAGYLLCYFLCRERVDAAPQPQGGPGFFTLVKELLGNRALLAIIGAALALLLASLLSQSMNMYLFKDYFSNTAVLPLVGLAGMAPMLALAPFSVRISQRFGKKEASCVGVGAAAVLYLLMWVLRIRSVWAYIVLMLAAGVGMGFFNMVIWAFITDVIDHQEVRTGRRSDGTVYAVYSFARKLGQALAGGVGGFALQAIGYVSSTGHVVQAPAVRSGIYTISTLVPGLCYLAVLLLLLFAYPLSKRRVEENSAILEARRRGK